MEADRKAKGQPYFGQDDEELEKEMYDIWDWKTSGSGSEYAFFVVDKYFTTFAAL